MSAFPSPTPQLDEFVQSVLAKFFVPTDPYLGTAQSFGAERISSTLLFYGHLVLFCLVFLRWRAVRNFYLLNRLWLLLSNLPLQQNDKA